MFQWIDLVFHEVQASTLSDPMPNASGLLFNNRYLTLKVLGCGGFGCTYLAVDTHLPSKPKCVVKQLAFDTDDPDLYELVQIRFQREAAILEMLGKLSPQIPNLYASSQEGKNLYLVQDWIDGDNLRDKLDKRGTLEENEVTGILAQLLPVLGIVHTKNVIHRDIKPANIMVRDEDSKPFLIDFGAVKEVIPLVAGVDDDSPRTVFIGTPPFAPLEQHQGRPVFASDLYSLGLTAICLLTGRQPAWKETNLDTGKPEIHRFRPGNWYSYAPKVSSQLKAALDKAIQPSVANRYQTAREMQSALRLRRSGSAVLGQQTSGTGAEFFGPKPGRTLSSMDRLIALAEKYNNLREAHKGQDTPHRRELMIGVFNEMVELTLQDESLNVMPYLDSDNWGRRLAAYVYLYNYPNSEVLSEMIGSVAAAGRQPFVQHRGIEAIGKIFERYHSGPEAQEGIKKLRPLLQGLGANTLRHAELSKILSRYDAAAAATITEEVESDF